MSTSVKHISNDMRGAPQISGTPGTLIAALDALFITGWGVTTALSVNVVGGVATATLQAGETFKRDAVVLIEGATPGALNGEARVITTSSTSITWATTAPDGAATGTITIKYAPQTAWQKVYAGTVKAVYRSTHVQSSGHYLRVDDSGTTQARVRGFETMSDIDTGTGPFPTDAMQSGGGYWSKSGSANTTPVKYQIFCDERFVIVSVAPYYSQSATYLSAPPRGFGDMISLAPGGDVWSTTLATAGASLAGTGTSSYVCSVTGSGLTSCPRSISGIGGAVDCYFKPFSGNYNGGYTGADPFMGTFPSVVDGQLKLSRMFFGNGAVSPPRAVVPGIFYVPQIGVYGQVSNGDVIDGSDDLSGHHLVAVADCGGNSVNNPPAGIYLVDITGPWR